MSSERSVETTGENVEEAIAKGLAELGVGPSEVIVEVLDEPSRGVFGIGARPARVRLQMLSVPKPPPPPPAPAKSETRREPRREARPPREPREPRSERPPRPREDPAARIDIDVPDDEEADAASLFQESYDTVEESDMDEEAQVGQVVLNELLERMSIRAKVIVKRAKPTSDGEPAPFILDVTGSSDLSRLIGRRGDTLASLQYVTRLITSRELQRRANIIVDVDSYKARRARMLRGLANRMADQAVESQRTVALEPMPPHERRIVHLTLLEREDVITRSIGEGPGRKVTIVPKSEQES
jgi:spoIIIJ-associated protein